MKGEKILITGGAGFIGSNFIRKMLEIKPDSQIIVLDALTYAGNKDNLKDIIDRITFVHGDIRNRKDVEKSIKGCNEIVHFAAESHVDRSISDPTPFLSTDVLGTGTLLDIARKCDMERFIHISTDEVYGSIRVGKFIEEDPFRPNSPYSASKAGGDLLARAFYKTYNLPVIIIRPSNNYGPYQHPEKLIPLFITNLLREKKVPLYGDGSNVRDWLFVEDCCEAILTILENGKIGEAYNISGECEKTNLEVTKTLLKLLNISEDMIKFVEDRKGHDLRYALSNDKIRKIGWFPKTSFDEGIRKTVEWYKKNSYWWKPLAR
jgi:dTDP-glucose 4,6-dehydratase